jgi:hypothetical protein
LRDPVSKITRAKWSGGVAQAVECLLCKHEAPSIKKTEDFKKYTRKYSYKGREWKSLRVVF